MSLVWGKGITSASGVATEQDQVLNFETREAFLAEFHCERENPRAGCIPVLPMSLRFNAALDPGQTGAAVLKGPDGKTWSAPLGKDGSRVTFEGPLPANADFHARAPGRHQGRRGPGADQRQPVSAQGPHGRLSAARQVCGALRHRRTQRRPGAARDHPQHRTPAESADAESGDRHDRPGDRQDRQRPAGPGRGGAALAAPGRRR